MILAYFLSMTAIVFAPLLAALPLRKTELPRPSRWYFGAVSTGIYFIAGHSLRVPQGIMMAVYLLALTAFAVRAFSLKEFPLTKLSWHTPDRKTSALLAVLMLLLCAAHVHILSHPVSPENWDALAIWYRKTKLLYYWSPLQNTPEANWGQNLNYPHLGPMLQMLVLKWTGAFQEEFGRLLIPILYIIWIIALWSLFPLKGHARGSASHAAYALWLAVVAVAFFDLRPLTSGYQETVLVCLGGMSAFHFCRIFLNREAPWFADRTFFETDHFLAFLFAGSLCLVKSEGGILGAILAASAAAVYVFSYRQIPLGRKITFLAPYLALFSILFILWPSLLLINGNDIREFQGGAFSLSRLSGLFSNFDRWPVIAPYFFEYFRHHWDFIAASLILASGAAAYVPQSRRPLLFLGLAYAGHLAFMPLPYLATADNLHWHLKESFGRLMFQHRFLYVTILCVAAVFLADKLQNFNKKQSLQEQAP